MAANAQDWSGGSSYFSTAPGSISSLPGPDPSQSLPSDWDTFWNYVGATIPGAPDLGWVGTAGDGTATAAKDVANGVSSAYNGSLSWLQGFGNDLSGLPSQLKSMGIWAIVVLVLVAVIVIGWKV